MQEMEELMAEETQDIISSHRQKWEADLEAMCELMREEWQEAQSKREIETTESFEKEKHQALADVKLELEACQRQEEHRLRQTYWKKSFKDITRANHQGEINVLEAVDDEKQRSVGRLCHAARELEDILNKSQNHVLKRMQKGSYFAEKEYTRVMNWEPKLKRAQARHWKVGMEFVEGNAQLAMINHTFFPTDAVIK